MAVDCSELSQTLTDLAMALGSRSDINTLDDVSREMAKIVPGVERQSIIDAIVESTGKQNKQVDDLLKKLNAIKTEARTDKRLQNKITQLETLLRTSGLPDSPKRRKQGTKAIERLRAVRDDLKKKISKSEPVVKKRLQAQIENLNRKIETGDILPTPRVVLPQSKQVERLQFERDELQREIRRRINNLKPKKIWDYVAEPFNTARGLITSGEFSAVLRQGGWVAVARPFLVAKNIGPMLKAFASKQTQAKIDKQIKSRPNWQLRVRAGDFHAPIDGTYKLSEREEIMQARLLDKIPGVAASNRAYTTLLNLVRADYFDTLWAGLTKSGEATFEEAKIITNFNKVSTGRGSLGALERAALPLNTVFFAPRYVASRFQLLVGQPFFGGNARTRKLIAKEYARYLIGMSMIYAIGSWAGGDVEFDPRSPDFGKIRFGKTRLDPLSGISQVTVLLSRVISGKIKSSTTGEITPLRGEKVPYGRGGTAEVVGRFLRSKLSPMFGKTLDIAAGENVIGEKVTLKGTVVELTVPMTWRDILEVMQEQGLPRATAISILGIFGMGIQTYGSQIKKDRTSGFQFGA